MNLLDFCETEKERVYVQAWLEYGSLGKAALALKVNKSTVHTHVNRVKGRAAQKGFSPEHDMTHAVPNEFRVKGVSTLYNNQGQVTAQWVKSEVDRAKLEELQKEALQAFADQLPKVKAVKKRAGAVSEDLLNLYLITDYHLGMLSWGEETGEDWNTDLAEDLLVKWVLDGVARSPNAHTALFADLGDFNHWDGFDALTPASKHLLDADTRFPKLVRVSIRVRLRVISELLKKYEHVHLIFADANHDPVGQVWTREWMAYYYENEPRVTVDTSPNPYYCYEFGNVALFFHHGHKKQPSNVDDVFVAQYREVFGRTKWAYGHLGHLHHDESKETNLMKVEQHRTLAPKDAYAARGGYLSDRGASVITYHKEYGDVGRITTTPEMLA